MLAVWNFLYDVAASVYVSDAGKRVLELTELCCCCFLEEYVVEVDNVGFRAVVGVESCLSDVLVVELLADSVEQSPVAISPSVDALLYISHNQTCRMLCQAVVEQHLEVLPLCHARVLELVYHDVLDLRPYLLVYERGVAIANHSVEQHLCRAQREPVGQCVCLVNLVVDASQQAQLADVLNSSGSRLVVAEIFPPLVLGLVHKLHESLGSQFERCPHVLFLHPCRGALACVLGSLVEVVVILLPRHFP